MQANSIHPGLDYAYTNYPSRGVTYYPGATRVRVNWVYKVESVHSHKRLTLVECIRLDEEGNREINSRTGEPYDIMTVRAREIVATWDEHLVERERHNKEMEERNERWRKQEQERQERYERERLERKARLEAEQAKQHAENERIYTALASIGIPRDRVTINSYEIRIGRNGLDLDESIKPTAGTESPVARASTQQSV